MSLQLLQAPAASATPLYEVRLRWLGPIESEAEVRRLPSRATPQWTVATRIAVLRGRNLAMFEHRVLRRLGHSGAHRGARGGAGASGLAARAPRCYPVPEETALYLALLFRTLAPMRSLTRMRAVVEGIEQMGREEASYWLSMALHRKNPRRVLTALRYLLTDPER